MLLRAIKPATINTAKGPRFVEGPMETADGFVTDGEVIEVDETFLVNPDVWEVVQRSADGRSITVLRHPVKGVRYATGKQQAEPAPS